MKFFDKIPIAVTKRSKENLDSFHITTTDFGRLDVPYFVELPEGSDLSFSMSSFFQAAPMVCPTRGRVFMNVRCFFVPYRILCNKDSFDWNLWINNLSNNAHPYILESDLENLVKGGPGSALSATERLELRRLISMLSLPDRFFNSIDGETYDNPERILIWPFLAYNRIWWDWYRDSNLIDDSQRQNYIFDAVSGRNTAISNFRTRYCCYGKDYFTTAKINAQEGDPVSIGVGSNVVAQNPSDPKNVFNTSGDVVAPGYFSSNIQWLRAANALQRYLERNNIAGGRVMARFLARFGVAPDSVRLDQSEYIGGCSYQMNIGGVTSPVQTAEPTSNSNPFIADSGSMAAQVAGKGQIGGNTPNITYHAKEHGVFMVIATLVPEVGYYQGLHKSWTRGVYNDKLDYLTPEADCEGMELIRNKEVCLINLEENSEDNLPWGFTRRYGSYCYKQNVVSNDMVLKEFRTGMQAFHLLRIFGNPSNVQYAPALNPQFTMITPEARYQFDRIFQFIGSNTNNVDHFEGFHNCICKVVLPKSPNSMPSLEEDEHSQHHVTVDNGGTRF